MKLTPWHYTTFIFLLLSIILAAFYVGPGNVVTGEFLDSKTAGKKAVEYINNNLVETETVMFKNVSDIGFVYEVLTTYQGRDIPVWITKDGKFLFVARPYNTSESLPRQEPEEFDAPNREKANIKFFVMSFCPFGNQAESGLEPVYRLLGEKVEWEPHYVIYSDYASGYPDYCLDENNTYCSMHGIQELNQDVRELCVWKSYEHSLWWDFVIKINDKCNSRNADTCWEDVARDVGIDVEKIKECQKNEAVELLQKELELNQEYGIRGSPTVFVNDVPYNGARTPEAYKNAICSGFEDPPEECETTLSGSPQAAPSGSC